MGDWIPAGERRLEPLDGPPSLGPLGDTAHPSAPAPSDRDGSPTMPWPAWTALGALLGGLFLAVLGGLVVDIPASALGANITAAHTPAGITIADTVIQDVGFVLAAVYFAQLGGRGAAAWQFGLRPPVLGWRRAVALLGFLLVAFLVLSASWSILVKPAEEKILEELGSNEGTTLLVLSAGLTCVIAPICEEFLFRGFIFTALRNWRGTLPAALITGLVFGGVHATSAPALDLVPLAALGFGLCLLYRHTGSLYPGIVAHSLNNSIAFASLEDWSVGRGVLVAFAALAGVGLVVLVAKLAGLIAPEPSPALS